jgi:hypothetical protein
MDHRLAARVKLREIKRHRLHVKALLTEALQSTETMPPLEAFPALHFAARHSSDGALQAKYDTDMAGLQNAASLLVGYDQEDSAQEADFIGEASHVHSLAGVTDAVHSTVLHMRADMEAALRRLDASLCFATALEDSAQPQQSIDGSEFEIVDMDEAGGEAVSTGTAYDIKRTAGLDDPVVQRLVELMTKQVNPSESERQQLANAVRHAFPTLDSTLRPQISTNCATMFMASTVTKAEMQSVVRMCLDDPCYLTLEQRDAMRRMADDDMMLSEFAGMMTILMKSLDDWHFTDETEGSRKTCLLAVRCNAEGKPRLYVDFHLVDHLFCGVIANRMANPLLQPLHSEVHNTCRVSSDVIGNDVNPGTRFCDDRFEQSFTSFMVSNYSSVAFRHVVKSGQDPTCVRGRHRGGPNRYEEKLPIAPLLSMWMGLCNARKAGYEGNSDPVLVVQTDVKDLGPSLPHWVLLAVLEQIGFSKSLLKFIEKYLSSPVVLPDGRRVSRTHGIHMGHPLSILLVDLLQTVTDCYVYRESAVFPCRVLDDSFLFSMHYMRVIKAVSAYQRVLSCYGLGFNSDKCRASVLFRDSGSTLTTNLIERCERAGISVASGTKPVTVGALKIDEQNCSWIADEDVLRAAAARYWQAMRSPDIPLFAIGALHNRMIQVIETLLHSPHAALGSKHVLMLRKYVMMAHNGNRNIGGTGESVKCLIMDRIRSRLRLDGAADVADKLQLPEAMFYWPMTAGGFGVSHPLIRSVGLARAIAANSYSVDNVWKTVVTCYQFIAKVSRHLSKEQVTKLLKSQTEESINRRNESPYVFDQNLAMAQQALAYVFTYGYGATSVAAPETTADLTGLMIEFQKRKNALEGEPSAASSSAVVLTPYWQHVIATFGPQMMSFFGSFEFMDVSMVPRLLLLQLQRAAGRLQPE